MDSKQYGEAALQRLGQRVTKYLDARWKGSDRALERETGIHRNTITALRKGLANPNFLTLLALSEALGLLDGELLRREPPSRRAPDSPVIEECPMRESP